jgi:hypothetical protein
MNRNLPIILLTTMFCGISCGAESEPVAIKVKKEPEHLILDQFKYLGVSEHKSKPAHPIHITGLAGPQVYLQAGIYNYAGIGLSGHATPKPWYVWATDTGQTEFRIAYGRKSNTAYFVINKNGTVLIGDAPPTAPSHSWVGDVLKAKLYVKGDVRADGNLTASGHIMAKQYFTAPVKKAPDFVFEKNYPLPELAEVKKFIETNKHLPEIPSGKVMETQGGEMLDMQMKLLQKVEELMLYTIQQEEKIKVLEAKVSELSRSE